MLQLGLLPWNIGSRNRIGCHEGLCLATESTTMKQLTWQYSLMPWNNICGNTIYCTEIVHVAIHPYCYNVYSMHIHPNAMTNYVANKVIVVATIIDCNILLCDNKHDYYNNIKFRCKVLLQRYRSLPLLTKVTLLPLEGVTTNMPLLQLYFTVTID
jgi:hypothetical protein